MLSTPLELPCGLTLKNRLAKSAMTEGLADDGHPSERLVRLYRCWAEGGPGLLLTGSAYPDALHTVRPADVTVPSTPPLDRWRQWADASKADGARVFLQINHAGRQTQRSINPQPVAPSAVAAVGSVRVFGAPRAATQEEIEEVIAGFVRTARLAEQSGFDGVQVHAAHGYLLNQFLSPRTNQRTDAWGGGLENRARLLLTIVREIRRVVRPQLAVAIKLNASDFLRGGFTEDEAAEVIAMLSGERIDLIEISGGTYERPASFGVGVEPRDAREAYFLTFARRARATTRLPLMFTGGFRRRSTMESALDDGVSVVGLARPLVMEPDLPRRLLSGESEGAMELRNRWYVGSRLAAAAELAWYSQQLRRLSEGRNPSAGVWPPLALARYALGDHLLAGRNRSRLRALPAGRA